MSTIDATGAGAVSRASTTPTGYGDLTSDEFFEIMMAELSNQDPMEPSDTTALLEQIAMLRSIEADSAMLDKLDEMIGQDEFVAATSMIGSLVGGVSERGSRVADVVLSVSRTQDGPVLNLFDGSRVPMSNVDEVVRSLPTPEDAGVDDQTNDGADDQTSGQTDDGSTGGDQDNGEDEP